ncbi:MAG: DNA-binding protein [Xanthobacteraceae bacterium]|nr:MAG: DNA-binding protein [Xanthobacteraceae bacterium]
MARSAAGLTQESAAASVGMARTTIVAIERDQRRVKPDELVALAAAYQVSVGKLLAPDAVHVDLNAKFRKVEGRQQPQSVLHAINLLKRLATGAVELERAIGATLRQDYPPPIRLIPQGLTHQAEDAAIGLRNRLGIGLGKMGDLMSLLELDMGVRVFCRPLDDGSISGLYAFDSAIGACILVNASHPWRRRLQTLAHETGHFVADRFDADVLDEGASAPSIEERFARRFGQALLMPAPAIRARFEQALSASSSFEVRNLILLAHQFDVSVEAMCRRLEDLELLARGTWESLRERGFGLKTEREVIGDNHSQMSPASVSPRLACLAAKALADATLSEGQLCEMLVIDRVELRQSIAVFKAD